MHVSYPVKIIHLITLVITILLFTCVSMADEPFSFEFVAYNSKGLSGKIDIAIQPNEEIISLALHTTLETGKSIVENSEGKNYSFPILEVEHTDIVWQAANIEMSDTDNV